MKQLLSLALSLQLICLPVIPAAYAAESSYQAEIEAKKQLAATASSVVSSASSSSNNQKTISALQKDLEIKKKTADQSAKQVADTKNAIAKTQKELEEARYRGNTEKVSELEKYLTNLNVFHDEAVRNNEKNQKIYADAQTLLEDAKSGKSLDSQIAESKKENYQKEVGSIDVGENAEYDEKSQSPGGFARYSKQLLGMATSIVGASIIEQCSFGLKIPSIATYMAGSITYLISEITGGQNQNKEQEERLARIEAIKKQIAENKGGGDVQRVLLEQRLKEEQGLSDFVSERITWLTAVGLMYTVAAGLAIMEETQGIAQGLVAANTACSGVAASTCAGSGPGYPACYAAQYAACLGVSPSGHAAANAAFASPASVPTGQAAASSTTIYAPGAIGYLTAYLAGAYAGCTPLSVGNVSLGPFSANLISFAYGMGFSMGENTMVGYVKLAISILNFLIPGLKQMVVAAYNYPIPRAITFGLSAALVGTIILGLNQVKEQTEGNIEQLSKVVDDFKLATNDSKGMYQGGETSDKTQGEMGNSAPGTIASNSGKTLQVGNEVNISKLNPMDGGTKSKQCFANEKGNLSYDNDSCSKAVNIKPVVVKVKGTGQATLKTAAGLITEIANDLASGDKDSAKMKMGQLNAMAANINKEVDKLKSDYNKALKKDKKEALDFDKAIANEMKKYDELFDKSRDSAVKENPTLASLAPQFGGSLLDSPTITDETTKQEIKEVSADSAIAVNNGTDLAAAAAAGENTLSEGPLSENIVTGDAEELLFGGDKTSSNPFGLNEEAYRAASANGYLHLHGKNGYSVGEGVAAQKENLFKLISNRYFLSYPKVMRKKVVESQSTQ